MKTSSLLILAYVLVMCGCNTQQSDRNKLKNNRVVYPSYFKNYYPFDFPFIKVEALVPDEMGIAAIDDDYNNNVIYGRTHYAFVLKQNPSTAGLPISEARKLFNATLGITVSDSNYSGNTTIYLKDSWSLISKIGKTFVDSIKYQGYVAPLMINEQIDTIRDTITVRYRIETYMRINNYYAVFKYRLYSKDMTWADSYKSHIIYMLKNLKPICR